MAYYEEEEIITVDPMEVTAEVSPTTPVRPRKKDKKPVQPAIKGPAPTGGLDRQLLPVPGEGLIIEDVSGGPTYELGAKFGDPLGQPFARRVATPPKFEVTGIRRRQGESDDAFLRRSTEFEANKAALQQQANILKQQTRAKLAPRSLGTAFVRGVGAPVEQFVQGLGIADPKLEELSEMATEGASLLLPTPADPSFAEKVASGLGSVASGALVSALPTGKVGSAFFYAVGNAGNQFTQAKAKGADDRTAMLAAFDALPVGVLEALVGFESKGLGALRNVTLGQLAKGVVKGGVEEGVQESLTQALNNSIAKYTAGYDPTRALTEGVVESGLIGAITGGIASGVTQVPTFGTTKVASEVPVPELMPAATNRASLFINDKAKSLATRLERMKVVADQAKLDGDVEQEAAIRDRMAEMETELSGLRQAIDEDMSFDLLPGLTDKQSPVLVVPGWVIAAVQGREVTATSGLTIPKSLQPKNREAIAKMAPSPEHAEAALAAYDEAIETANQAGLSALALVSREALALGETNIPSHETIHVAQGKAGEVAGGRGMWDLHNADWAANHPTIRKIIDEGRAFGILNPAVPPEQLLAVELPAYVMAGESKRFFDTSADAIDFVMDYFNHIIYTKGVDALNALETTARVLPEKQDVIPLVRSMYETWVRESVDKGLIAPETGDRLIQSIPSSSSVSAAAEPGTSPGTGEPVSQGPGPEAGVSGVTGTAPIEQPAAAQPPPPVVAGDKVKVRGYSSQAEVTEVLPDGTIEVKFPDGTTDQFNAGEVAKVTPSTTQVPQQATPVTKPAPPPKPPQKKGGIPSLPGPMRLKKSRIWVNRIGPGDTPGNVKVELGDGTVTQFPIDDVRDAGGKRIKDPVTYMLIEDPPAPPPPTTLPNPSLPPGSPLYTEDVSVIYSRVLAKKFRDLLDNNSIPYNFTKSPMVQVYEALAEGELRDADVEEVLNEEGIGWEDFAEDVYNTYSRAGATLQTLSEIVSRHWNRLRKDNPALLDKLIPASRQIDLMAKDLNDTVLGMNLFRRSGRVFQKAILTQYVTAINNFMTATGRVPVDAVSSSFGQVVKSVVEGKGKTWTERLANGREAAYETLASGFEAWRALNPMQLRDVMHKRLGSEYQGYERVISEVEEYFPDIHTKLFAKPLEMEAKALQGATEKVAQMKLLLHKVQSATKRKDLQQKIRQLDKKIKRENSLLVKAGYRGPEYIFDQLLRPMQFGEFLMRRPRFVARLAMELKDRGINLNQAVANSKLTADELLHLPPGDRTTFKNIPEDAIKAALSDALEFTMALEPSQGPDARYIEGIAHSFIKMMNHLGPLNLLTDFMFPRAVYSAARTFYDYSPIPFLFEWGEKGAFSRIFLKKMDKDPNTGDAYLIDPASRADYERFGRASVGTFLFILASTMFKAGMMGDDWYQLKNPTGKKDKSGNPTYIDIRKWLPFARIFQLTNLVDRFATGRVNDIQAGVELTDIAAGMKKYSSDQDIVDMMDAMGEWWSGPDRNPLKVEKMQQMLGKFPATLLTPFLNLRSVIAAADEDENVRKDLRGYGFWGPSIDKLPWLRRQIPDLTYPTYRGTMKISESPIAQQLGFQISASPIFMGREFQRMGINLRQYLPKDADPIIDRKQNEVFSYLAEMVGNMLEDDPDYRNAPDEIKAARWEEHLVGPKGIAALAREEGLMSNPPEAMRREAIRETPGKFLRKATGVADYLDMLRRQ